MKPSRLCVLVAENQYANMPQSHEDTKIHKDLQNIISVLMILLNIPEIENGLFRFAKVSDEVM